MLLPVAAQRVTINLKEVNIPLTGDVGVSEEKGLEVAAVINSGLYWAAMASFAPVAERA